MAVADIIMEEGTGEVMVWRLDGLTVWRFDDTTF